MSAHPVPGNPFLEEEDTFPSKRKPYLSSETKRLVWIKGTMSKVVPVEFTEQVIDIRKHDKVRWVKTSPQVITIDLSGEKITSRDNLPFLIKVDITARPRVDGENEKGEKAISAIAVYYDEAVARLRAHVLAFLRKECEKIRSDLLMQERSRLAELLKTAFRELPSDEMAFDITLANLCLICPEIEGKSKERQLEELEAGVITVRHKNELSRQKNKVELEREVFSWEKEKSFAKIALRAEEYKSIASMNIEGMICAHRDDALVIDALTKLEVAKETKNNTAYAEVFRIFKDLLPYFAGHGTDGRSPNVVNYNSPKP